MLRRDVASTDSSRCIKACTHRCHIGRFSAQQSFETGASTVSAVSCSPPPLHLSSSIRPLFFGPTLSTSRYASPETPVSPFSRTSSANVALIELEEQVGGARFAKFRPPEDNRIRLRDVCILNSKLLPRPPSQCSSLSQSFYPSSSFELSTMRKKGFFQL